MTEHLPECHQPKYLKDLIWGSISRDEPFVPCICDALRAAEMRGVDAQLSIDLDVAREDVWNEAITAAREAVAALVPSEFWEGIEGRPPQWWIVKAEAIAAIDALSEEKQ